MKKLIAIIFLISFLVSCGGPGTDRLDGTAINAEPQEIDGSFFTPLSYDRVQYGYWSKDGDATFFGVDAKEGFEIFMVEVEVDTQGEEKKVSFSIDDAFVFDNHDEEYVWAWGEGFTLSIKMNKKSGFKRSINLCFEIPKGAIITEIEIKGAVFRIPRN